ncbi:DUF2158 domain-containing protein [Stenotrophomonas sp. S48]|nr:DUF2158 domain-containing protein [Stenotrophomonas sp. S48]MBK0047077.1 DUF2158 domain-containing protein [Stenotrophomonas sp. S49]
MVGKDKYKVGDKVKLNVGGPDMAVYEVHSGVSGTSYRCKWFAGKKLEVGFFAEEMLDAVPEGRE